MGHDIQGETKENGNKSDVWDMTFREKRKKPEINLMGDMIFRDKLKKTEINLVFERDELKRKNERKWRLI